jgi:hypothetical protein
VILLGPQPENAESPARPSDDEIRRAFGEMTKDRTVSKRLALKDLSAKVGLPVNVLYRILEK